ADGIAARRERDGTRPPVREVAVDGTGAGERAEAANGRRAIVFIAQARELTQATAASVDREDLTVLAGVGPEGVRRRSKNTRRPTTAPPLPALAVSERRKLLSSTAFF